MYLPYLQYLSSLFFIYYTLLPLSNLKCDIFEMLYYMALEIIINTKIFPC
jgi:hypothetical protein